MSPIFASAKSSRSDVFVSFGDRKCDIEKCGTVRNAGAEIVGLENTASDCPVGWKCRTGKCMNNMRGWKMRDWKMRHRYAGVKNAGQSSTESSFAKKSAKANVGRQKWHWSAMLYASANPAGPDFRLGLAKYMCCCCYHWSYLIHILSVLSGVIIAFSYCSSYTWLYAKHLSNDTFCTLFSIFLLLRYLIICFIIPRLHDTTGCPIGWLSNQLSNEKNAFSGIFWSSDECCGVSQWVCLLSVFIS